MKWAVSTVLVAALQITAAGAAPSAINRCEALAAEVRVTLEEREDMRDEAYTAIMWARLDAEAALARGDAAACLRHLDFPRRALGIHEESTPRH